MAKRCQKVLGVVAALAAITCASVVAVYVGGSVAPAAAAPHRAATSTPTRPGYYVVRADGTVDPQNAAALGSRNGPGAAVVGAAGTMSGKGYWLAAADGGITAFGDAALHGSATGIALAKPVVGMAATPDGGGYWLVAADGGVFAYGDARFFGSAGNLALAKPVVGMAATPDGGGYWLVAADGGVFAYGDARFFGSAGNLALAKPVVGMAATPDGGGYWLVAADGGVFAYGDARFDGSAGNIRLVAPMVGMALDPNGPGYWLVGSDGGVFAYGAPFEGSDSTSPDRSPAVALVTTVDGHPAPAATDDTYQAKAATTLAVPAPGVLGNDILNGATITGHSTPAHGSVTLNPDGSFAYTPTAGYVGTDSFTYTVANAAGISTATVTITVTAPPKAVDDSYQAVSTQPLTVTPANGILANDTLNGATITGHTTPTHGTVLLNPDGSFTYTPTTATYGGPDSFTYTLTNSAGTSTATVALNIDGPPITQPDSYTATINQTLTVPVGSGVLANDEPNNPDETHASLSVASYTQPKQGTLTLNPDGSFTYTPTTGYTGTDSFTYTATDQISTSAPTTVTITVEDSPPIAEPDRYNTDENQVLTVTSSNGVLVNDVSATPLTVTSNTQPQNGTLTLNPDGSFTYTPTTGFHGSDSFDYTATDKAGETSTAVVDITVADIAPVTQADSYTTNEDQNLVIPVSSGVLANDTSPNPLTVGSYTQPQHGTLTLNPDGSFTYAPTTGYHGSDSFTYTATDGTLTSQPTQVTLNVADIAPVTRADSYSIIENETLVIPVSSRVLANDTSPNPLTVGNYTQPQHGTLTLNPDGSFTYTPNTGYYGSDSFTYTATDGILTSQPTPVTITVTPL